MMWSIHREDRAGQDVVDLRIIAVKITRSRCGRSANHHLVDHADQDVIDLRIITL
jgi:hypothetical protein